ncbi:dnaJ homolog subfamily B member 13-like [Aphidius gifuensis]|uniref:dnaJ homolog subfamily B member 13-like n=1 Tax=Aphidius gifuensis TaxID=684658 RepID=UPI001CDBCE44|nr:dnaJ homolog subfamily B member 13-like [Aphidius gifuensis]
MCSSYCQGLNFDIDYYGVLKLNKNCNDLDIKKAFRRLAIQYNPERQKDDNILEVFSLICEAYEVLSDSLRRTIYDFYGETGLKNGVPGNNENIEPYVFHGEPLRTYRNFFGTESPYADLLDVLDDPEAMKRYKQAQIPQNETIIKQLFLTLKEIFHGVVKIMKIERLEYVNNEENIMEMKDKFFTIDIKPGLPNGSEFLFPKEGDRGANIIPADIVFVTTEIPHDVFERKNDDLVMIVDVFLKEALTGTVVKIQTLDDRVFRVPITSIITPDYRKLVPGEGLPLSHDPTQRGDLIINFKIEFPIYLCVASKNYIKKAFEIAVNKDDDNSIESIDYIYQYMLNEQMHRNVDDDIPK